MVTLQNISMELMKPVKGLAEWGYPFSETLETYCSLFEATSNKGFSKAGLVLQNSTAVFVHRVDDLWSKAACIKDIFLNLEHEEAVMKSLKKRDKKTNISFENFVQIDFAKEIDKNIDSKKNVKMQDNVKPKSRCFAQLEKSIVQCIPIDIYDINGEIIGKKYDFRCNQNISISGVLIDEFAPEDFCRSSNNDSVKRKSSTEGTTSSNCSRVTESLGRSPDTTVHDNSDKNINSDAESEREYDDSPGEVSDLITSVDSSKNLSLSSNSDTISETAPGSLTDNSRLTLTNTMNESQCTSLSDTDLPADNTVDSTVLSSTNISDVSNKSSNSNVGTCVHDDNDQLGSSTKSIDSQERTSSGDDNMSLDDTNNNAKKAELSKKLDSVPSSPLTAKCENKLGSKSLSTKRKPQQVPTTPRKRGRVVKHLLKEFCKKGLECIPEKSVYSLANKLSMFRKRQSTCIKYIREYDPLQYDHVTNETLDFLGFRLHVAENVANDDVTTTSSDDEMFELPSSSPTCLVQSTLEENLCESLCLRPDSPSLLPVSVRTIDTTEENVEHFGKIRENLKGQPAFQQNIEKWHEFLQPKLLETERRSTFCIRDYASHIMQRLRASGQRKVNFDNVIPREDAGEVARYFLASLDLASKQNVDLNMNEEHNMEVTLHEEDRQGSSNVQADSYD